MSDCDHCAGQDQAKKLRAVVALLENATLKLDLELIEYADHPERVQEIAQRIQRLIDDAQQRMDDARALQIWQRHTENFPETMGNIFRSPRKHES